MSVQLTMEAVVIAVLTHLVHIYVHVILDTSYIIMDIIALVYYIVFKNN